MKERNLRLNSHQVSDDDSTLQHHVPIWSKSDIERCGHHPDLYLIALLVYHQSLDTENQSIHHCHHNYQHKKKDSESGIVVKSEDSGFGRSEEHLAGRKP